MNIYDDLDEINELKSIIRDLIPDIDHKNSDRITMTFHDAMGLIHSIDRLIQIIDSGYPPAEEK